MAQIDKASDVDVDNDGWDETVLSDGVLTQTKLYLWDIDNGVISFADINAALDSRYVIHNRKDGESIFSAGYYDTVEMTPREVLLIYRDGFLDRLM